MNSSSTTQMRRDKLTLRDLCTLALLGALMMGAQVAMASLPNIEPVTVLMMCTALVYGRRAFYACYVFVLLEGLVYGFGFWFLNYLYVWAVLVAAVLLLRRNTSYVFWSVVAAIYGLSFGALCAIPYFITGGWAAGFAYWVGGIGFDLLHCAGNAVMAALLLRPLTETLRRLREKSIVSK
jgi:energy-coupling factor transport system substrate-specific component